MYVCMYVRDFVLVSLYKSMCHVVSVRTTVSLCMRVSLSICVFAVYYVSVCYCASVCTRMYVCSIIPLQKYIKGIKKLSNK